MLIINIITLNLMYGLDGLLVIYKELFKYLAVKTSNFLS